MTRSRSPTRVSPRGGRLALVISQDPSLHHPPIVWVGGVHAPSLARMDDHHRGCWVGVEAVDAAPGAGFLTRRGLCPLRRSAHQVWWHSPLKPSTGCSSIPLGATPVWPCISSQNPTPRTRT